MNLFSIFGNIQISTQQAQQQLQNLTNMGHTAANSLMGITRNAISVAGGMAIFNGLTHAVKSATDSLITYNAMMEGTSIGMKTLIGDGEKAIDLMKEMKDFAARTPFEFAGLTYAVTKMKALGFETEELLPTLKAVGDASAALGGGTEKIHRIILALGQMRMRGRVTGDEMRQLAEAGIGAWDMLAKASGKTTAEILKLSRDGLIPANEAIKVLVSGMAEQFPDMMENLEDSWGGVTSTIRDNMKFIIGDLGKGVFDAFKGILIYVRNFTNEVRVAFDAGGIKEVISRMFPINLVALLTPVLDSLKEFMGSMKEFWSVLSPILNDFGESTLRLLAPLGIIFMEVATAITNFSKSVIKELGDAKPVVMTLLTVFLSYTAVVGVIGAVKGALMALRNVAIVSQVIGQFQVQLALMNATMGASAVGFIPKLMAMLGALKITFLTTIAPILAVATALAGLGVLAFSLIKNWTHTKEFFVAMFNLIEADAKLFAKGIEGVFRTLVYAVSVAITTIPRLWLEVIQESVKFMQPFAEIMPEFMQKSFDRLKDMPSSALRSINNLTTSAKNSMISTNRELDSFLANSQTMHQRFNAKGAILASAVATDIKKIFSNSAKDISFDFDMMEKKYLRNIGNMKDYTMDAEQIIADFKKALEERGGKGDDKGTESRAIQQQAALEKSWLSVSKMIISTFNQAGKSIGSLSEESKVEMQKMLDDLLSMGEVLKEAGFGDAFLNEIKSASDKMEDAIDDSSGKAGDLMLSNLVNASRIVADNIKNDSGQAGREMEYAYTLATLNIIDRFRKMNEEIKKENISMLNDLFDKVTSSLRARYEFEQRERVKDLNAEKDAQRQKSNAIIQSLERVSNARIQAKQRELDIIDGLENERDEEAENAKHMAEINELQVLVNTAQTEQERFELQQKLSDATNDYQQVIHKRRIDAQRDKIRDEIDMIKDQFEQERRLEETRMDNYIEARDKQIKYLQEDYYPKILSEANINARAERIIFRGNVDELLSLLGSSEYQNQYRGIGQSFGEGIYDGSIPYIDQLRMYLMNVLGKLPNAPTLQGLGGSSGMNVEDSARYLREQGWGVDDLLRTSMDKQQWVDRFINNGRTDMTQYEKGLFQQIADTMTGRNNASSSSNSSNSTNQSSGSSRRSSSSTSGGISVTDAGGWDAFDRMVSNSLKFHDGGLVENNKSSFAEFVKKYFANGLKSNEVPAILEEGELVVPKGIISQVLSDLSSGMSFNSPKLAVASSGYGGNNKPIHIDVHDNVFKDGTDVGRRIVQEIKKLGL